MIIFEHLTNGATTFSMTTLGIRTLSIAKFNIIRLEIMTVSLTVLVEVSMPIYIKT